MPQVSSHFLCRSRKGEEWEEIEREQSFAMLKPPPPSPTLVALTIRPFISQLAKDLKQLQNSCGELYYSCTPDTPIP